jgi:FAD/FMN-containing dehydrogenase
VTVNEAEMSVWVSGGFTVMDLITYLASFVTLKSPNGYTLQAYPAFVYQSVAGAISTGTHGSHMKYNSLSHQVGKGISPDRTSI